MNANDEQLESIDEEWPEELMFAACRKILEAGAWLVRNGYGRMAILPYAAPSGCFWRCEFHPIGKPGKPFYRYSTSSESKYLQNHCGGSIRRDVSPKKLAQAIMVSVPDEIKELCTGDVSAESLQWLESLERTLDKRYVPQAFHEYTDDYSRWALVRLDGGAESTMEPQPGYVPPGREETWRDMPFWRAAAERWTSVVGQGPFKFDPAGLDRLPYDEVLAVELIKAVKDAWPGDIPDIFKATLATLIKRLQNAPADTPVSGAVT